MYHIDYVDYIFVFGTNTYTIFNNTLIYDLYNVYKI